MSSASVTSEATRSLLSGFTPTVAFSHPDLAALICVQQKNQYEKFLREQQSVVERRDSSTSTKSEDNKGRKPGFKPKALLTVMLSKLLYNFSKLQFVGEIDPGQEIVKKESEEQPPSTSPVSLMTSTTSNRESPSCPDSTTSPSPLMAMASVSTASSLPSPTTPTRPVLPTVGGAAPTSPQVTTAHALALLPTLYSAYPAAAAAGAGPPGLFSYIAAGLLPPPPTHPFHPLASEVTAARTSAATAAVKRPIAHLATPGLPPLI